MMYLLLAGVLFAQSCCALTGKKVTDVLKQPVTVAFSAPESYGKTHFILGKEAISDTRKPSVAAPAKESQSSVRSYFSPDDDVKKELISLIDSEQTGIELAVFVVTEPEIARALSRAQQRGVQVAVVTDVGCLKERAHKMSMLCDEGCSIYVYNPPSLSRGSSLMHHKFALFDSQKVVWTGSYNFTKAASKFNQENAVIIADNTTFQKFAAQFKRLKERSYRYGKSVRA